MKTKIRQDYPPANHMLRDLGISFMFEDKDRAVIRAPVVPEVCSAQGTVRIGVLATLVDVLGGILSAKVLQPDWMATASLSLHTGSTASDGTIYGAGHVVRVGSKMAVIHVDIHGERGASGAMKTPVGVALMTFARLRTEKKPVNSEIHAPSGQGIDFSLPDSGLDTDFLDKAGVWIKSERQGMVGLAMRPYVRNSLGALQGGMAAVLADVAGQSAAGWAAGMPMPTRDLVVNYLSPGRVGPFETRARVIRYDDYGALTRVEVVDTGAQDRLMAVAMNTGLSA